MVEHWSPKPSVRGSSPLCGANYKIMSCKDMCETIVEADILRKSNGEPPTAHEIFNYSPTGELFMIFEWYAIAKEVLKEKKKL